MIVIPSRFEQKLKEDKTNGSIGIINITAAKMGEIFENNDLYFFEEYTDHGIRHINSVLKSADELISDDTFLLLSSDDILLLILAIFMHDIGMHIQLVAFREMVAKTSIDPNLKYFDKDSWSVLWNEYLDEAQKFSSRQRFDLFGDEHIEIKKPDLDDKDSLRGVDKKIIGEFVRRNHPRIAHEVALYGLESKNGSINLLDELLDKDLKDLCGLLARSHGIQIRQTFDYIRSVYSVGWKRPHTTHLFYLMVVLRLADYFQIDSKRVLKIPFQTKEFKSPVSFEEHIKHLQTKYAIPVEDDEETLFIYATPPTSTCFLALENLFTNIQKELDTSWAILGEIYGKNDTGSQPKIIYRRLISNIKNHEEFSKLVNYHPKAISFKVNNEIPKLLISPLYGDDPSFGVRELLQNAVDACLSRIKIEEKYIPIIEINLYEEHGSYFFSIKDNGIGMTVSDIDMYFLNIGGSFRKSPEWYKYFVDTSNKSTIRRSGRFGIGVLASYMLGNTINVVTRNYKSEQGTSFNTSLEQKQIELIKINNVEIGTTILIELNKTIYSQLIGELFISHETPYSGRRGSFTNCLFYEWYVLNSPKITYKINGKPVKKDNNPSLDHNSKDWNIIRFDDFNDVRWKYSKHFEFYNIVCNGIIIPTQYFIQDSIIKNTPLISVFDYDAKLPLSLNRNFISSTLPFENKIKEDIFKNIIFSLLNISLETNFKKPYLEIHTKEQFIHKSFDSKGILNNPQKIIYTSNGFTLSHPALVSKFKSLNQIDLFYINKRYSIIKLNSELNNLFRISEFNYVYDPIDIDNEFRYLHRELSDVIIKSVHLQKIKNSFVLKLRNYKNGIMHSEGISLEMLFMFEQIDCDILFVSKNNQVINEDIKMFSDIVDYYLGSEPIIPYNISNRKKKFPKAFKELARFDK